MFCKWCGKRITNNGIPCPSCGRNQDALENGNGFWNLCSIKPEDTASVPIADVVPDQKKGNNKPNTSKDKGSKKADGHKRSKARFNQLHIVTICLLLLAIVVICVGINRTGDCLSELVKIRSDISSLHARVNGGFEEIADYHVAITNPEELAPENTEGLDVDAELSIDELLENNEVSLFQTTRLSVDVYEIEAEVDYKVYIASGDVLTEDNVKIYWQQSVDAGDTWQTISEDTSYLVAEHCEDTVYRVLCLMDSDATAKRICYYALTAIPATGEESSTDETLSTTNEAHPEETTSVQEDDSSSESVPERTENVTDPTVTSAGSDEAVS